MSAQSLERNPDNTSTPDIEKLRKMGGRLAYFESQLSDPLTGIVEGPSLLTNLSYLILMGAVPWEEGVQLFRQGYQNLVTASEPQPELDVLYADKYSKMAAETRKRVASITTFLPVRTNVLPLDEPTIRIQLTSKRKEGLVILGESRHDIFRDHMSDMGSYVYDINNRSRLVLDILEQPYTIVQED